MGANSSIEWCHHTFNAWWGCQRVSPGCQHCYAETLAKRWNHQVWGPAKTTTRRMMSEDYWKQPLKWNKSAGERGVRERVFCASMADVFEDHPDVRTSRGRLWNLIAQTPNLDWLLLTKRPEYINYLAPWGSEAYPWPANVWVGTSVEDQQRADERIPELLKVPARVRFLSCEPLLGPVDLRRYLGIAPDYSNCGTDHMEAHGWAYDADSGGLMGSGARDSLYDPEPGIHWVICGGESGHGARPMHQRWARSLRDQCKAAEVAYFFKQHGEWIGMADYDPYIHGFDTDQYETRGLWATYEGDPNNLPNLHMRVGKKAAGRQLDGRIWDEVPE